MARTAVVTGGSGGIGNAAVESLATDHNVIVQYYSNKAAAEDIVADVRANDGSAMAIQADVSNRACVADLFDQVRSTFGEVDVLINNAGAPPQSGFTDRTAESINAQLQINLSGVIYCSQEVVERIADRDYGRIVNVASTAGLHGSPSDPVYGASKGGVVAFTKSLAKRYTEDGILTNAVTPSITDTSLLSEERRDAATELFPQNRIIDPSEVATAIRFLVSEAYSSGKVIEIAGGRYL